MMPSLFGTWATTDVRDQLVIAPHHPDRLGRPHASLGAIDDDRLRQALTWNVFRTLELVAPSFWLRRLHIRLTGEAPPAAPQTVKVSLWRPLPLPPVQRIDGALADVIVDVVIETEHAVWTLMVPGDRDRWMDDDQRAAHVIDAGAWLAGARDHTVGVIEPETDGVSVGAVIRKRYSHSSQGVQLRSATRGPTRPSLTACGRLRWMDLVAILRDCAGAPSLPMIDRALARNALTWLEEVGLCPIGPLHA